MPKNINFEKYTVSRPHFYHFDRLIYQLTGCGSNTIAYLTGDNPYNISKLNKNKDHYSDFFIKKYLTKKGFKLIKLTDKKILNSRKNYSPFSEVIQDNHVLLLCLKLTKKQSSWVVIFGSPPIMCHNFELTKLKGYDFLNYIPHSESKYIVWHKSWK